MKTRLLYLALCLAGRHVAAHAGLIKCKTPGGGFTLQDTPCAPDASRPAPKRPVVGEKDPTFSQKSRPGANWDQGAIVPTERPRYIPPPQIERQPDRPSAPAPRASVAEHRSRARDAEIIAYNQDVMAQNRVTACRNAQQQQGVVNRQRPIYHVNSKGETVYAEDSEQAAISARAQREVAAACN